MNLTKMAVDNRAVTYFSVFLLVAGGITSFFSLGQLEDPEFTIKTAVITTSYPGASPEEVELEVTDRIELALQEMKQLDYVESTSRAGMSSVSVEIRPEYWSDRLPQVWDELRRKIRDIEHMLPPGASRPVVSDDFGDVFGFQLAVVGDGFSYAEMEKHADSLKKELSLVDGVARVDLWGVQSKIIYLDVSQSQLAQLGLTEQSIQNTLQQQNLVVDAGQVDMQNRRFRIAPTGQFTSPENIADLTIRPATSDMLQNMNDTEGLQLSSDELIQIRDIGTIRQGYKDPPQWLMYYNGQPAIGVSVTNISGINTVDMGRAADDRLEELIAELPVGIEVHRFHWQSDIVDSAVKGFLINFGQAVAIVLIVLTLAMGWRMGMIIGTALVATILGSFILMAVFGIDLQIMSLGALVIALGMMVDNAIVVADGMVVRLKSGMEREKAAIESASLPSMPLLGATVVAVMAFYPIYASVEGAGEYCRTLFTVVGISLLFSWLVSVTLTPLQCIAMIPDPKKEDHDADPYKGKFFQFYRSILTKAIRFRMITVVSVVVALLISMYGFQFVDQMFFPDSSMTKFMVDYWTPEGTRVEDVAADLKLAEQKLLADERVESVISFVGQGPPRFYLPVDPEGPNPAYGQLIVNLKDYRQIDGLIAEFTPWFKETYPQALVPMRKYGVGPATTWKFELRISGPAVADPAILRNLGQQGVDIVEQCPLAAVVQTNWRQQVQKVVPDYNQQRARWASVTREDLASTTKRAYDGLSMGLYREQDDLIPIVLRHSEEERQDVGNMDTLQIRPSGTTNSVPLSQVTSGVGLEWEDPAICRRNRRRTITVQANPIQVVTLPTLRTEVLGAINAIELPQGYSMEWGGEYEDTVDSQAALIPGIVPTVAIMFFIIVLLFNEFRPLFIIILTIPFVLIGITAGLLATGTPFGFLALLGAMSLSGMMIKNAVVLLDEVKLNLGLGQNQYAAITNAAMSRLRPVVLAAATTVLGVIPLLQDVFWIGMAVTVMAGLTLGTVLTMVLVPTLYSIFYRVKPEK